MVHSKKINEIQIVSDIQVAFFNRIIVFIDIAKPNYELYILEIHLWFSNTIVLNILNDYVCH